MATYDQPLIPLTDFEKTPEELRYRLHSQLFVIDNILEGKSLRELEAIGGVVGLAKALSSDTRHGIHPDTVQLHAGYFGTNTCRPRKFKSVFRLILLSMGDRLLQILTIAAVVSMVVGVLSDPSRGWMEGTAILVAVVIVVTVTTANEYAKQKQFIKLNAQADDVNTTVTRGGKESDVSIYDLVVGDLVNIRNGDILSVDGVLVRAHMISVDESSITGESELVRKNVEHRPFLISGSKVVEGTGMMIVAAVGRYSALGKTSAILDSGEEMTPLQEKLEVVADDISKVGGIGGLSTFLALTAYIFYKVYQQNEWTNKNTEELIKAFSIMVAIIVVAVPEGLPLAVTLSLAYSVGKMKEENNFVRHLHACETMGGANNICSDKTGTLTENKMTVTHLYAGGNMMESLEKADVSVALKNALVENMCCNSTAFFETDEKGKQIASGSMTECAMLALCSNWGVDYTGIRSQDKEIVQYPFSSSTKRMSTVIRCDEGLKLLTKGAAEIVLELCSDVMLSDGRTIPMTSEMQNEIQGVITQYTHNALRTMTLAYKILSFAEAKTLRSEEDASQAYLETKLILVGIVGIQDPVRKEVPEAVAIAHRAGVTVRMVTGDNIETATAIAKQCGIIPADYITDKHDYVILLGCEFRELVGGLITKEEEGSDSDSESNMSKKSIKIGSETKVESKKKKVTHSVGNLEMFSEVAARLRVLARSSPEDKFLLVTGLKQLGNVVAVTGDGSNDAPALKKSDVGLAMNITGTGLAKEAADIILIDDNFASIITAIKWGRNIFDNVRKFLQFQLTVNIVAMMISFIGAVITEESPLTAVQMLWVNLIMDTLAALALATSKPDIAVLNKTPYPRDEYIVTGDMALIILGLAVYEMALLLVFLFLGPELFGVPTGWGNKEWDFDNGRHFTIFFHIFVFLQVFNEFNATKLQVSEWNVFRGVFQNWVFVTIQVMTIVIQILLVEFGG